VGVIIATDHMVHDYGAMIADSASPIPDAVAGVETRGTSPSSMVPGNDFPLVIATTTSGPS